MTPGLEHLMRYIQNQDIIALRGNNGAVEAFLANREAANFIENHDAAILKRKGTALDDIAEDYPAEHYPALIMPTQINKIFGKGADAVIANTTTLNLVTPLTDAQIKMLRELAVTPAPSQLEASQVTRLMNLVLSGDIRTSKTALGELENIFLTKDAAEFIETLGLKPTSIRNRFPNANIRENYAFALPATLVEGLGEQALAVLKNAGKLSYSARSLSAGGYGGPDF